MKYCRINLKHTNYNILNSARLISKDEIDCNLLQEIYKTYCEYKNFSSVMPIFDEEFYKNDVIGYYYDNQLIAFSLIGVHNNENVENYQFAWTYSNPELRLGLRSIEHECAYYKSKGYKYLYLGQPDNYKQQFDGFEIMGKLK